MRQLHQRHFVTVALAIATALSLAACTGRHFGKTAQDTAALHSVRDDLEYAQLQVRETEEAMSELVVADQADLAKIYRAFSERVDRTKGVGARLVRHADGMHYKGEEYLVEEEKSVTECRYPRLSDSAGTMTLHLGEAFEPIAMKSDQVKRAYRAFEFDVTSIREILYGDQTLRAVRSMEVIFRKAQADGSNLEWSLEQTLLAVQNANAAR